MTVDRDSWSSTREGNPGEAAHDGDEAMADTAMAGEERRRVVYEWNDTAIPYPTDLCLHHLFERQAALTPDAVALVFDDQRITYRDLDRRANDLAHQLIGLGVGPE